ELLDEVSAACFHDTSATLSEGIVSNLQRHGLPRLQGGQVKRADPGHRPKPRSVQGVVLFAFENAVVVSVLADQVFDGPFYPRPEPLQESVVGRHLMFAVDAQDSSGKSVVSHVAAALTAVIHGPVLVPREAEIDAFAQIPF